MNSGPIQRKPFCYSYFGLLLHAPSNCFPYPLPFFFTFWIGHFRSQKMDVFFNVILYSGLTILEAIKEVQEAIAVILLLGLKNGWVSLFKFIFENKYFLK